MFKQAELICQQYIKKYPSDMVYHQYLAKIYKKQNILKKAICEYEFVIEKTEGSIADYFDLIPLLFKSSSHNKVISLCDKLLGRQKNKIKKIALNPFLSDIFWYIGMSNYYLENYKEATMYLQKSINCAQNRESSKKAKKILEKIEKEITK